MCSSGHEGKIHQGFEELGTGGRKKRHGSFTIEERHGSSDWVQAKKGEVNELFPGRGSIAMPLLQEGGGKRGGGK